jgi:integrase
MKSQTFGGALSQWLTLHTLGRRPRAQKFNQEIAAIVRRQWPGFLNASPGCVTEEQVTEFAARISRYCPSRWNALVGALRFITPEGHSLKRRPLRAKERPLLTQGEFTRLLEELDKRPQSKAGLVVRFLVHTGLRINEARQLSWENVETDCIRLPARLTKNGRGRVIPFINGIRDTLEKLRLVSPQADRILPQAECKRSLQSACRAAGLPRLSHHDFRHLFATRCIQSGVDMPTVARWLGHSDGGALLAKTYFHLIDEHSRKMAERVRV